MIGPPGIISHIGVFAGGMCLGQVMRDRQQRAHERRMAQQQADHDALMREIQTMDFEALIALSQLKDSPMRRCPKCGRATYNRADITEGYCGACHEWT
jgi:hypothetical protein